MLYNPALLFGDTLSTYVFYCNIGIKQNQSENIILYQYMIDNYLDNSDMQPILGGGGGGGVSLSINNNVLDLGIILHLRCNDIRINYSLILIGLSYSNRIILFLSDYHHVVLMN